MRNKKSVVKEMRNKKILIVYLFCSVILILSLSIISAESICQYATKVDATSENLYGSFANYTLGPPNAPSTGECTQWSGFGYSWTASNWNVSANLTLYYPNLVNASNFTIYGDYDMCWSKMWVKNSKTGISMLVHNFVDRTCYKDALINNSFIADTIVLETCGDGWTATDAVQLCGNVVNNSNSTSPVCGNSVVEAGETCDDGNANSGDGCSNICKIESTNSTQSTSLCQYATSATATSENLYGSLASYATGAPNAPFTGQCTQWSGFGYSWTASNWNVSANLTLKFTTPVNVSNLTVFGDYDMCWKKMWVKNSKTGISMLVHNYVDRTCYKDVLINNSFIADTIILETCGDGWTATDAVQLCGNVINNTPNPEVIIKEDVTIKDIKICNWKDCKKGAVSISMDDNFTACWPELEANGFRGTYYISYTSNLSDELWNTYNSLFIKGHEIGAHSRTHWCTIIPNETLISDIDANINDIINHTSVKREDLISFAYPCGYIFPEYKELISKRWNFISARGYNANLLENSKPKDYFNLSSFNSHFYPGGVFEPPNYYSIIGTAESEGKWVNLVFHNLCTDDGIINYLPSRNVWVDTVGNVVKYSKLRDNTKIYGFIETNKQIKFKIKQKKDLGPIFSNQNLTIEMIIPYNKVRSVTVDNIKVPFRYTVVDNYKSIKFNVYNPTTNSIIITKKS